VFRNVLDLGTGTGLLAFAAARLWPVANIAASDIDPISIDVVRENAVLNGVRGLRLVVADGLSHRELVAHAPYDLVIANILAQPLIDMAAMVAASVAHRGTLVLAGLLDTQAAAVARAYRKQGMRLISQGAGEWPVLVMRSR
jgi:ribosomal protein L11 methyltransferase